MTHHIKDFRSGISYGYHPITFAGEKTLDTQISFAILKIAAGKSFKQTVAEEAAFLHMDGSADFTVEGKEYSNKRNSLFNEAPFCIHLPKNSSISISAITDVELAVYGTPNDHYFPPVIYNEVINEPRGEGQVNEYVRTIFDDTNSNANCQLVLGEVVSWPGHWSSYPPHHHPHPEIYHYRFDHAQGYGHAELGDDVFKVRSFDTVKILDGLDHAQCSTPEYAMYYIWVIHHLPQNRYKTSEFTQEHICTMDTNATLGRAPEEVLV